MLLSSAVPQADIPGGIIPSSPGVPMTSSYSRILLSLALATPLLTACGSGRRSPDTAPPPPRADVTSDDVEKAPGNSVAEHLKGRIAGVTVTTSAEGGIAVRIRGASSVYGNNEPLYVLDGMPITPGPGGSLTGVNPYDIESIKVLKNPADTAIYGVRGANGVIIITTKKGSRKRNPG